MIGWIIERVETGTNQVVLAVFKMSVATETQPKNLSLISIQPKSIIQPMKTNLNIVKGNRTSGQVGHRQTTSIQTAVKETGMVTESRQLNPEVAIMINPNRDRSKITDVAKKSFTTQDGLYPSLMKSLFVRGVPRGTVIQGDLSGQP